MRKRRDDNLSVKEWRAMQNPASKAGKYKNVRRTYTADAGHERSYHSIAECEYARKLDLLVKAGEIISWVPQVRFDLPGEKHYVDFMVIRLATIMPPPEIAHPATLQPEYIVSYVEVKGYDTPDGKRKRKAVEKRYGITIEVTKG